MGKSLAHTLDHGQQKKLFTLPTSMKRHTIITFFVLSDDLVLFVFCRDLVEPDMCLLQLRMFL